MLFRGGWVDGDVNDLDHGSLVEPTGVVNEAWRRRRAVMAIIEPRLEDEKRGLARDFDNSEQAQAEEDGDAFLGDLHGGTKA